MSPPFDVFLSYNRRDASVVLEIYKTLEKRGLRAWLDVEDLTPGRPWLEEVEEVLAVVQAVAVLVGQEGLGPWELPELRVSLDQFVKRKLPVIPVLLPGSSAEPEIPLILGGFTRVDLRNGLTRQGIDRLVHGITGTKPLPSLARARKKTSQRHLPGPYGPVPSGQPFLERITGIHLLWVEGGRFQIGKGRRRNTAWVRLSPFWIGETAVTNRQYRVFTEHSKHYPPDSWQIPRFSDPEQPVVEVNWHDAVDFCRWLSQASGLDCSLCSEAQWEYAARCGDGRTYPWGNEEPTPERACYGRDPDSGRPEPAGIYRKYGRGPFGTLDQAGSVWEWCRDAWRENAYDSWLEGEPLDPVTKLRKEDGEVEENAYRVLRGACWESPPDRLKAALRYQRHATYHAVRVGFRVAVNLPEQDG
ncbi:MAG TPA: SUMF1/EgtB/PvdO family nonheme iron enzyme [Thermoanaerobaculia bacterium]|nr:SUMF1/EgtB/PvdO family nonheme iron enzyme [Thermoanaerobaculia bacterium]